MKRNSRCLPMTRRPRRNTSQSVQCLTAYDSHHSEQVRFWAPWGLSGKESACQYMRLKFNPWVGRSSGEGNGNPLQFSCLKNLMERGTWQLQFMVSQRVGHYWETEQEHERVITLFKSYSFFLFCIWNNWDLWKKETFLKLHILFKQFKSNN